MPEPTSPSGPYPHPFGLCVCVKCGPPWRNTTPKPAPDASPIQRLAWWSWMALCPTCGDKRCPGAVGHGKNCTGRNGDEDA